MVENTPESLKQAVRTIDQGLSCRAVVWRRALLLRMEAPVGVVQLEACSRGGGLVLKSVPWPVVSAAPVGDRNNGGGTTNTSASGRNPCMMLVM